MNFKYLSTLLLTISTSTFAWQVGTVGDFKFENVGKNVFVMHGPLDVPNVSNDGFINNPAFIEGLSSVIVFDPASSTYAGENILKEIKKITSKPVVGVFNTHVHGDHWLGNEAIKNAYPEAKFYGHMNMISEAELGGEGERWIELYTKYTEGLTKDTKQVVPGFGIGDGDKLTIGSEKFIIHSPFPASHSSSDIMIEHVNSKTLFAGDNIFNNRFGRFDESSSIHNNLEILNYAKSLDIDVFVPGHGFSGDSASALEPWLNYLNVIMDESKKGYEDDLADYEVKPLALERLKEYQDWAGYDSVGAHINKLLREIEDRDE